jgi:hypothetical protein
VRAEPDLLRQGPAVPIRSLTGRQVDPAKRNHGQCAPPTWKGGLFTSDSESHVAVRRKPATGLPGTARPTNRGSTGVHLGPASGTSLTNPRQEDHPGRASPGKPWAE